MQKIVFFYLELLLTRRELDMGEGRWAGRLGVGQGGSVGDGWFNRDGGAQTARCGAPERRTVARSGEHELGQRREVESVGRGGREVSFAGSFYREMEGKGRGRRRKENGRPSPRH